MQSEIVQNGRNIQKDWEGEKSCGNSRSGTNFRLLGCLLVSGFSFLGIPLSFLCRVCVLFGGMNHCADWGLNGNSPNGKSELGLIGWITRFLECCKLLMLILISVAALGRRKVDSSIPSTIPTREYCQDATRCRFRFRFDGVVPLSSLWLVFQFRGRFVVFHRLPRYPGRYRHRERISKF